MYYVDGSFHPPPAPFSSSPYLSYCLPPPLFLSPPLIEKTLWELVTLRERARDESTYTTDYLSIERISPRRFVVPDDHLLLPAALAVVKLGQSS